MASRSLPLQESNDVAHPQETLCNAALTYAARGWAVIPLHDLHQGECSCQKHPLPCPTPGKHPRLDDWPHRGTTDAALIRQWWYRWPHANIGVITGAPSQICVLDIDPRNGGDESLQTLEHTYGALPETPMVLSGGGGRHFYFAYMAGVPSVNPAIGINFLSDGHQAVVPPSLHPSGKQYLWELSSEPDDVPLAGLPDWLAALLRTQATEMLTTPVALPEILPSVDVLSLNISDRIKYLILKGKDRESPLRYPSRSEALFAAIMALLTGGHDDATIAAVITDPENAISEKPLTQKNIRDPRYVQQVRGWVSTEIGRAKAKRKDHEQQESESRARDLIAECLGGLECRAFYKEGIGLDAIYTIVLNGHMVCLGTATQLQNQTQWRSLMLDHGLAPMPRLKDDKFCAFLGMLMRICTSNNSESSTLDGLRDDLATYRQKAVEFSYWALEHNRPFVRDNQFFLHVRAFMQWQHREGMQTYKRPMLMAMLRHLGFRAKPVVAWEEEKQVSRSYWVENDKEKL
jgi:hypothetical protein